jgi:hypothetical protein
MGKEQSIDGFKEKASQKKENDKIEKEDFKRSAALALAVLMVTNAALIGCEASPKVMRPNLSISQTIEEESDDEYTDDLLVGGGGTGYYRYTGRPVVEGSSGYVGTSGSHYVSVTRWGGAPNCYSRGGYAVVRGGSFAS